ncbi:hypothetical protein [Phaffia rhodozyma]|uniref:Uncharacterized protein n=1 Tax=Phaffia rhodozyma TaxID=264483 RepID=A0A0F7SFM4_PHARH|nr:hypothetical protein [Phaffia rhodozyma]
MNQIASTPVAISYNHEPRSGSMSSVLSADTTSTSNSDSVPSDSALSASSLDMLDRYSFTMHHYHDALLKMSKEKKAGPKDGPAKA